MAVPSGQYPMIVDPVGMKVLTDGFSTAGLAMAIAKQRTKRTSKILVFILNFDKIW
jgi:hypothetical protein